MRVGGLLSSHSCLRRAKTAILHNFLSVRARAPSCGQFAQFEKAAKCQSSGEDDPTGRYKLVLASLRGLVVQCSANNGSVAGMQGRVGGQEPRDADKLLVMEIGLYRLVELFPTLIEFCDRDMRAQGMDHPRRITQGRNTHSEDAWAYGWV